MPLQVALLLQRLQLVGDARRAAQAYRLGDLTDRGRVPVPPHGVADELEHLFLPHAQRGHGAGWISADWTSADRISADRISADRMNSSQICVHRSCAYRVCARHPLSLRRSLPRSKVTSGDELSSIPCSNTPRRLVRRLITGWEPTLPTRLSRDLGREQRAQLPAGLQVLLADRPGDADR